MVWIGLSVAIAIALAIASRWAVHRLHSPPDVMKSTSPISLDAGELDTRVFRRFARPYRGPLLVGSAMTMTMVAIELAAPWPLALVIDSAIGGQPVPTQLGVLEAATPMQIVLIAAAASVALTALAGIAGYLVAYLNGGAQARIGADLRSAVFARLQGASTRFHDRHRTGDLLARLSTDVSYVEDMLVAWFETALPEVITIVGVFIIVVLIDPMLALLALAIVPVLIWWARRAHHAVRTAELDARSASGSMLDRAGDSLRHVRAVQVFSRQESEAEAFTIKSDRAASSQLAAVERSARLSPFAEILLAAGTAAVLVVGAQRVLSGTLTVGVLLVLLAYIGQLYGPIESLSLLVMTMGRGAASRGRLIELLASEREVTQSRRARPAPTGELTVQARNVTFGYEADVPVLRRLSFTVRPSEIVCIVGSTGAGKSSILSLLVRLFDPDGGTITLGGVDIRRLTLQSLRERIAFVPQDLWILDGTIAENIEFGRFGASRDQVEQAGRAALVDEFVDKLPHGYDSVVGDEGTSLSGGQRRRIAVARALIRDAPVIVLDEPTAGLDAESASSVWDSIASVGPGRTILVVTHDLDLAQRADRIYVVDGGRNRESGSHAQLIRKNGRYSELWSSQSVPRQVPTDDAGPRPRLSLVANDTGRR